MIDPLLVIFSDAEHHGRRGLHSQTVRGAVHQQPVFGQAFQARDAPAHLVIENFRASAGYRVQSGGTQAHQGLFHADAAVLGDGQDFRGREAVQMDLREALLDAAHHAFEVVYLQLRVQSALHEHAGAAQLHGLADFFVDGFEIQQVAFRRELALERTIEGAEAAILGAEVGVIDVAVDDVSDDAVRMQAAAHRVGFHADADQIVGAEHLHGLLFGKAHGVLDHCPASAPGAVCDSGARRFGFVSSSSSLGCVSILNSKF